MPTAEERVPDRQGRVLPGRGDDEERDSEKGDELRSHDGILSAATRARRPLRPGRQPVAGHRPGDRHLKEERLMKKRGFTPKS